VNFLAQPYFLQFCIPLLTVGLSIFLKYVTRNDMYSGFRKEDLAVGLDLAVTALLIFIASSAQIARSIESTPNTSEIIEKVATVPWIITAFLVGIWGVSTIVRKVGWENEDRLNIFWGIVVPDLFGIFTLIFVVNWIG